MSAKRARESTARPSWIHSSRLHVVMYSMLLVATPFLILRRFLQEAIGRCSRASFEVAGIDIPIVPIIALIVLVALLIYLRAHLTRFRILGGVLALLMVALGQQINDYYYDHDFYELQYNWHYIAYAIFAFMMHRDLAPRGVRLTRIMLITYCSAAAFSTFDETFQFNLSGRAFEMGDVAKDVWGATLGMVLLCLGEHRLGALRTHWKEARQLRLRGYLQNPLSLLILLIALALLLLCFSSLLNEFVYWELVLLLTIVGFAAFFLLLHVSQYRWPRYGLWLILSVGLIMQCYFFARHRGDNIVHNRPGLVVYKGIPLYFFDVMIFPDGTFRPVEKKAYFSARDRQFFMKQKTDIILIASGAHGEGGRGFPKDAASQFVYNPFIERGTQVMSLKTPEACRVFNRLKREQKNVLFVIHNSR